MASTDLRNFFLTWTQSGQDAERKQQKFLEKGLDRIMERKSKLFARFKKGKNTRNPVVRWMEENSYQNHITGTLSSTTLTFSGSLLGEDISNASLRQHIKKNVVLYRMTDGVRMICTAAPDYDAFTVTVAAHGNHTLSNDSAATTYRIVGQTSSDYDTTYVPRSLDRKFRTCSSQIWKDYIEIPHSRRDMAMEVVADEIQHQLKRVLEDLQNKIASSAIMMAPVYSGGAYKTALETENPAMTGILSWADIIQGELSNPNTYVDMNSVPVGADQLNALIYSLWMDEKADYNMGDWVIACHPVTHQYLSDEFVDHREFEMEKTEIGYEVTSFKSKIGKTFPILADEYIPEPILILVDTNDVEWGYYGKQGIRVKELAESYENIVVKKITFQTWGMKKRKPRQIGMLYDMPTTYSS